MSGKTSKETPSIKPQPLDRDERFLFEYLPLSPFIEEELKKKEEGKRVATMQGSGCRLDTFNMKVIENDLVSNQPSAQRLMEFHL